MSSDQSHGAVVTGAASGIGRAIAGGLRADGFSVVIADLDEVKGRAVAEDQDRAAAGAPGADRATVSPGRIMLSHPTLHWKRPRESSRAFGTA